MSVTWLIEAGVYPSTAPRLINALEACGISWVCYQDGESPSAFPRPGACVLFWGSLGAAYEQRAAGQWQPGAIGDPEPFRCRSYYEPLHLVLANPDAVFTTVAEFVRRPDPVLSRLGNPSRVFVRPDSPLKPFAGRTLPVASLSLAALDHGYYYEDENLPIVVSTEKRIGREWRFVIADGLVIASCEYDATRRGREGEVPSIAQTVANQVASNPWQPAPLYIVDIAEVDDSPRVMEINLFSGSDLYDCDVHAVISACITRGRKIARRSSTSACYRPIVRGAVSLYCRKLGGKMDNAARKARRRPRSRTDLVSLGVLPGAPPCRQRRQTPQGRWRARCRAQGAHEEFGCIARSSWSESPN